MQVNDIISFNCDSASALENSNQFAFYLRKNSASLPPNVLATLTKGIHYFFEHADTRDMIAQVLNRFEFDDNIGPLRALYESILLEEKMPVPPIDLDNRQSEGNLQTLESYEMKVQELAEKNVQMEKKEALQRRLLLERPAQAAKFSDAMRSWVLERSDGGEEFPVICLEIGESYEVGELVMRMFRVNAWVTSKKVSFFFAFLCIHLI